MLIRICAFLPLILLNYCSSTPKNVIGANETIEKNEPLTTVSNGDLPIEVSNMGLVNAAIYGCKGDGIQLRDFSLSGNKLTSLSAKFNSADIGKTVSIAKAGIDGEHLISVIKTFESSNKVLLKHSAITAVSNVMGSYGTDNINYIQNAIDAAIADQKKLFFEPGVFLIGDKNTVTNTSSVQIRVRNLGDHIVILGSGKYKTIFRELDGKTQRLGRYTKMFYHYLKDSPNVGTIVLSNFSLDKNGRSLTKNPSTRYEWEQAHAWSWAGHKNGAKRINSIQISDIEIIDKIGGGINFSSTKTNVGSVLAQNITESKPSTNINGVVYGYRGDLEFSCFSENIILKNVKLKYIQLEPVKSQKSSESNKRICTILDSSIDTIEYTEGGLEGLGVNVLNIKNSVTKNFRNHGVEFVVENTTISAPYIINSIKGVFKNCKFLLEYDDTENIVKPINATYLRTIPNKNKILFYNCQFVINSDHIKNKPNGFAITSSSKVTDMTYNEIYVDNCKFDSRLQGSIDAYGNGKWIVKNSQLSGYNLAILIGGYKEYFSDLILENNDYSQVSTDAALIKINNHNTLWKIRGTESQKNISSRISIKGNVGRLASQNTLKIN